MFTEKNSFTFTITSSTPPKTYLAFDVTDLGKPVIDALEGTYAALRHVSPSSSPVTTDLPASSGLSEGEDEAVDALHVEKQAKQDKSRPRHDHILKKTQEQNRRLLRSGQIPPSGWDETTIAQVLRLLPEAQKNIILRAAAENGPLGRMAVYEAAGRTPEKSLKGIRRPVIGAMEKLRAKGLLQGKVEDLLQQIYDPAVKRYQAVEGLQIPLEVAVLIQKMGLVSASDSVK